jgi:hypothetical protein
MLRPCTCIIFQGSCVRERDFIRGRHHRFVEASPSTEALSKTWLLRAGIETVLREVGLAGVSREGPPNRLY